MGIYSDSGTILGIRILIEAPELNGDFYVKYEFTGEDWTINASRVLPYYLGNKDVKIQTLHPFSTSYNLSTGQEKEPGNLWLDNNYLKLEDLYKY
jgi:hypothetical protein